VKDMPREKHRDLDWIVDQLDWEANVDPNFKANHYLEPITAAGSAKDGFEDKWIVYGRVHGEQLFSAKELTVYPGKKATIKDAGASSIICVQGEGRINKLRLSSPKMIGFYELTEDEVFVTEPAAKAGLSIENTSATEPLVLLRYFGPNVHTDLPDIKYVGNVKL